MSFIDKFRVASRKVVTTKVIYDMNQDRRKFVYRSIERERDNYIQEMLDNGSLFWRSLFDLKRFLMNNDCSEEDNEEVTQLFDSLRKIGITFIDNKGTLLRVRESNYDIKKLGISYDIAIRVIMDDLSEYYYMTFDYVLTHVLNAALADLCLCECVINQAVVFNENKDKMHELDLKAYNQLVNDRIESVKNSMNNFGINDAVNGLIKKFRLSEDTERKAYDIVKVYNRIVRTLKERIENILSGISDEDMEYVVNNASKYVTAELIGEFLSDIVVSRGGIIKLD